MKYLVAILITLYLPNPVFCQIPLKNKEFNKTDTGFIFYWAQSEPAFVSVKHPKKELKYNDFSTDSLSVGYGLSYEGLGMDLDAFGKKYGKQYKLYNYKPYNFYLMVIAVKMNYTIYDYELREDQLKRYSGTGEFKLLDKMVKIKCSGGIPIKVNSITPLISIKNPKSAD